ncbi:MAG TPA: hypothetical protein VEA16_15585 [Vicinamibacterales bacterium]|nr:hypothetical protein [Vicinamibacterales bacterium]
MLKARLQRELDLDPATTGHSPAHLSAASGLVALGEQLYVIADDEHALGVFPAAGAGKGTLRRVFAEQLPQSPTQRKAAKADLEVLLHVPVSDGLPQGLLLALGSGSTAQRERGVWFALDGAGRLQGDAQPLDLGPLYAALRNALPALNLEGAVVRAEALILLQRASRIDRRNALIHLPLGMLRQALASGTFAAPPSIPPPTAIDLGECEGVPWSFTDATVLDDGRILFSAVAEDSPDTYSDGRNLGSAIGWLAADGRLESLHRIAGTAKIEGIAVAAVGGRSQLWMVTDADDPQVPAQLLQLDLIDIPRTTC